MPMVGHIAQTGQIVATDFRAGNVSKGTNIKKLRIDAAGYQASKSKSKSKPKSNSTCPVTTLLCTIKSKTLPLSPIKWCILKSGLPI
jgi:hypothetical protein